MVRICPETGGFVYLSSGIKHIILHSCSVCNSDSPLSPLSGIMRADAGWTHVGRGINLFTSPRAAGWCWKCAWSLGWHGTWGLVEVEGDRGDFHPSVSLARTSDQGYFGDNFCCKWTRLDESTKSGNDLFACWKNLKNNHSPHVLSSDIPTCPPWRK